MTAHAHASQTSFDHKCLLPHRSVHGFDDSRAVCRAQQCMPSPDIVLQRKANPQHAIPLLLETLMCSLKMHAERNSHVLCVRIFTILCIESVCDLNPVCRIRTHKYERCALALSDMELVIVLEHCAAARRSVERWPQPPRPDDASIRGAHCDCSTNAKTALSWVMLSTVLPMRVL